MLTAPWHERDAQSLVERLGVPVYYAAARHRAVPHGHVRPHRRAGRRRQSRPCLAAPRQRKARHARIRPATGCRSVSTCSPGHKANDTVLWVESQRAVISGDTLVDFGLGLEINERWLRPGVTREEIVERGCARYSHCRSSTCLRRTAGRPTGPPSSARCPRRPPRDIPTRSPNWVTGSPFSLASNRIPTPFPSEGAGDSMGRLIVSTQMTLDGVIDVGEWYVADGEHDRAGVVIGSLPTGQTSNRSRSTTSGQELDAPRRRRNRRCRDPQGRAPSDLLMYGCGELAGPCSR